MEILHIVNNLQMLYLRKKYISLQKYCNMYIFKHAGFFYMRTIVWDI